MATFDSKLSERTNYNQFIWSPSILTAWICSGCKGPLDFRVTYQSGSKFKTFLFLFGLNRPAPLRDNVINMSPQHWCNANPSMWGVFRPVIWRNIPSFVHTRVVMSVGLLHSQELSVLRFRATLTDFSNILSVICGNFLNCFTDFFDNLENAMYSIKLTPKYAFCNLNQWLKCDMANYFAKIQRRTKLLKRVSELTLAYLYYRTLMASPLVLLSTLC